MPTNETLRLDVSWNGTNRASQTITIIDTVLSTYEYYLVGSNPSSTEITEIDIPTYSLASNVGNVNEGGSVTFTLTTTKLDAGTTVPYTISGVSVADISLSSLTGNFTVAANGQATLTFNIVEDNFTEGAETLTLTLNGKNISKSVTINDTSMSAETYALSSNVNSVNEGSTVTFTLTTTNVATGTNVAYTISGVSVADINLSSLTGNFNVGSDGKATLAIQLLADSLTEGTETLTVTLTGKSVSKSVTVNDTSLTPAPNNEFNHTISTNNILYYDHSWHEETEEYYWEYRINITSSNIPTLSSGLSVNSITYLHDGVEVNSWNLGPGGEQTARAKLSAQSGVTYPNKFWLALGNAGILYTHSSGGNYTGVARNDIDLAIKTAYESNNSSSIQLSTTALW